VRGFVAERWVGYVLLAAAVLNVIGFFVGGPGGPPNPLLALLGNLGTLLLLVALGWLGYLLWTARAGLRERLTRN
jgi:predicted DNA-binding transcriptional regulator